jgi:hypothetical protein
MSTAGACAGGWCRTFTESAEDNGGHHARGELSLYGLTAQLGLGERARVFLQELPHR